MKSSSIVETANTKQHSNYIAKIKKSATLGVGVLNGVIGDFLHHENNGFSIQMQFYVNEEPLVLIKENILITHKKPTSKICILIHGLMNDETIWNFPDTTYKNYGTLLQQDVSYTPFFVRYNTGLHISENGKCFSQLVQNLVNNYPVKIDEISIIAHSMGGLVTRSACYYAPLQNANWVNKLNKLFFLGTPHLGAPLEKFGNALTFLLKQIPISYTQLTGDFINLRSSGIKDLRYGYLTDEDWKGHHPDELLKNNKTVIPLLEHVDYYLISGTLTEDPNHFVSEWFGDVLVRKSSAIGQSKGKHHLSFNLQHHKEFAGFAHLKLVDSIEVYEQIKEWFLVENVHSKTIKSTNKNTDTLNKEHFPQNKEIQSSTFKSLLKLVNTGVAVGINQLEVLNKRKMAYRVLNQIPVVNVFSKEIENIQNEIGNVVIQTAKTTVQKSDKLIEKL
jgi:triacylglycerol esterase/lipase EstA (alpha/beta hydrolase family)